MFRGHLTLLGKYTITQRPSYYRTKAIGLSFFSAIKLADYWISDWQIRETIGLSDIGSRPQSIGLSGIRLTKNHRLPTSGLLYFHILNRDRPKLTSFFNLSMQFMLVSFGTGMGINIKGARS
jgi:hypothetical protein